MASTLTDSVVLTYKGLEREFNGAETSTSEKLIGSRQAVVSAESLLVKGQISDEHPEYGVLDNWKIYQQEGPFWILEKTWKTTSASTGGEEEGQGESVTADQPTRSELSMAMLAKDLRTLPNYRKNWNNDLWCNCPLSAAAGGWKPTPPAALWENAAARSPTQIISGQYTWKWIQSMNDGPIANTEGYKWVYISGATKPGLEYYQVPSYTIRESGRYLKKSQAAWVTEKRAGKIAVPIRGDFGIVNRFGGNWLCEGGSVNFDGAMWVADLNYTWAPAPGWDSDIYNYDTN